jgi:MerR family transcriptional regulator, light-induced transcriptional regulator
MRRSESDPEQLLAELGRAYAKALLAGDEVAAELVARDAIDAGLSTAEIDDEIIAPALWLIGRLWARGEISVADEHLATEISLRVLALQREVRRTARERTGRTALLAAPAGELHTVALQMIANLLRDAGYTVLMLGADVPSGALAESVCRHEPEVICLTATMPDVSDRVMLAIHEVERGWQGAGYVIGGRGLSARMRAQPRIHVCKRVSEAVEAADAVVKRAEFN